MQALSLIRFNAIFQVMNTTDTVLWPTVAMTMGNNTIWLGNAAYNVTPISYNSTVKRKLLYQSTPMDLFLVYRRPLNQLSAYPMKAM